MLNWAYPDFTAAALALALALLLLGWHWRRTGRLARLLGRRARHRGWKTALRMVAGALLLAAALAMGGCFYWMLRRRAAIRLRGRTPVEKAH